jgi:hypothetical protein
MGKAEVKRPLGISARRLEDYIKMDLGEIAWCGTDWIHMVRDGGQGRALLNTIMDFRVP